MKIKNSKIMLYLFMVIVGMFSVTAYSINEILAPTAYSTQVTLTINVSGGVNSSGITGLNEEDVVNVTILNKSSTSGAYGVYNVGGIYGYLTNASGPIVDHFWNQTITLTEERQWIILNFTNATAGGSLTSEVIIDIDLNYFMLEIGQFGAVNISMDTGHINTTGLVLATGGLFTGTAEEDTCSIGQFKVNTSDEDLCLCVSDGNWKCVVVT